MESEERGSEGEPGGKEERASRWKEGGKSIHYE